MKEILLLARYVAKMRAWVYVKTDHKGQLIDINIPEPESPTRLVKQLQKLVIGLAIVRGHSTVQK